MRPVSAPDFADIWNHSSPHEDSADPLVLGGISDDHGQAWRTCPALQRQLGLCCYETAWMMLHKLRRAMVNAAREPLRGEVEVDDTWVGGEQAGLRGADNSRNGGRLSSWWPWKSVAKLPVESA